MGEIAPIGSVAERVFGTEIHQGQLFSQNIGRCMEESYPTAFNLGSGDKRWPGWCHIDLDPRADIVADIRELPLDSNCADAVAAIHVLEHFYRWEVPSILGEWKRILKPGGKLILELPCMNKVFGYIAECYTAREHLFPFMTLFALWGDPQYQNPFMVHKWGWIQNELMHVLKEAGFRNIEFMEPRYHFKFRDMRVEAVK